MSRKLLLDCDPGLDDALALLLAYGDPELELVGVTTVGGNVTLANTTRNALQLREYLGFTHVTVAPGADRPLVRVAESAEHVHGAAGLGNVSLPRPSWRHPTSTRSTSSCVNWARRPAKSTSSRPAR